MNIDIYTHYLPPQYAAAIVRKSDRRHPDVPNVDLLKQLFPKLCDMDLRLPDMDLHQTTLQVLTPLPISPDLFVGREGAAELTRIANDGMADAVLRFPKRFAGVALLFMDDPEAAEMELRRCIHELGFKGAMIFTNVGGKPIDDSHFDRIYGTAVELEVPLWLHPVSWNYYDWVRDYLIWQIFAWPMDSTLAMARLVYGGVMARFPRLKVITHHAGGVLPFLIGRVIDTHVQNQELSRLSGSEHAPSPSDADNPANTFKLFYGDTALSGIPSAMDCAYQFFGSEKLVYGSDYPFGPAEGESFIRSNHAALECLRLTQAENEKVLFRNSENLLKMQPRQAP
jgi:aminocarboxymuconate-semialdehyde decarboxylase